MNRRIYFLTSLALLSTLPLPASCRGAEPSSACDILVPKLTGKNAEIMTKTLQQKGYRVVESDLISANFDSSGPLAKKILARALKPLEPGTLFLKIRGTVSGSFSTQPDTFVFLYLATKSEPGLKILGESRYNPWIASFSRDPQLFDLRKLPNCDESVIGEVAASKLASVAASSAMTPSADSQRTRTRVNSGSQKGGDPAVAHGAPETGVKISAPGAR